MEFPKTSQPSPHKFLEVFEDAKENEDSVICILLSSKLSGTCQSAHLAKDIAEKVEAMKSRVRIYAGLDTLEYLYKSGQLIFLFIPSIHMTQKTVKS